MFWIFRAAGTTTVCCFRITRSFFRVRVFWEGFVNHRQHRNLIRPFVQTTRIGSSQTQQLCVTNTTRITHNIVQHWGNSFFPSIWPVLCFQVFLWMFLLFKCHMRHTLSDHNVPSLLCGHSDSDFFFFFFFLQSFYLDFAETPMISFAISSVRFLCQDRPWAENKSVWKTPPDMTYKDMLPFPRQSDTGNTCPGWLTVENFPAYLVDMHPGRWMIWAASIQQALESRIERSYKRWAGFLTRPTNDRKR